MSRIEKAMEKASQLAGGAALPEQSSFARVGDDLASQIDVDSRRLVASNDFNLPITEEFRKMKSAIIQLISKDPSKNLLLVTSSVGGEGKSITALNLAISLAQEHDQKVLIIDADMRKPSVARYLGLPPQKGLAECLLDNIPMDNLLIETGLGSLTFLPAGVPNNNPVELFSSQKMRTLLAQVRERYKDGYIVIDASPVLPFAEARILSTLADGVVYIVKERGTALKNVMDGLAALNKANILGLVYNKATTASLSGGYHYYYYDYQRYNMVPKPEKTGRLSSLLARFRKTKPASKPGESGDV